MVLKYVYDSGSEPEYRKKLIDLLDRLEKKGMSIKRIDTHNWGQDKRWDFYLNELIPLSVLTKKKLRGRIRTHKAGDVYLVDILIAGRDFSIGEESIQWLEQVIGQRK